MLPKLGILAGSGSLPRHLIAAAKSAGRDLFVIAFEGHADQETTQNVPHAWVRLGAVGEAIALLRSEGCTDLVMGGAIKRPSFTELRPDWRAAKFFMKAGIALLGDDGLLKAVRRELEEVEGFHILGPQDVLKELLVPEGVLVGEARTVDGFAADIERGRAVLAALSLVDVGQAVAVQQGLVLAVEAIEGTSAMIARAGALAREGSKPVLVKMTKIGQDDKIDLPTIGPDTISQAAAAGFAGVYIEAGRTLVLEKAELIARATSAGLFVQAGHRA